MAESFLFRRKANCRVKNQLTSAAVLAVVAEDGVVADVDGLLKVDGVLEDNLKRPEIQNIDQRCLS